jgi:threonyl-tRNA synthetase
MSDAMIQITLPDGSQREYSAGTTGREIAESIGKRLLKAAVGIQVDGQMRSLFEPIEADASVAIVTRESPEGLEMLRHSAAHIMADAIKRLYPHAKLWKGPAVEDERYGFYYDIDFGDAQLRNEDLPKIEQLMRKIVKEKRPFERRILPKQEAIALATELEDDYKIPILKRIPEDEEISFFSHGEFVDLCRGPHIPDTAALGQGFAVLSIAGAYFDGDAGQKMLTRVYGHAFADEDAMKAHKKKLEEAAKRDHRRIGTDLDLFSTMGEHGGGLILWHPKGGFIRHKMEEYWRNAHLEGGYDIVYSPHVAKAELWQTSGHLDFYKESMYSPMEVDGQDYLLKPMNCPFHVLMYKARRRSYRELPLRWAELGTVYRYEGAGMLHGLMRVRGFTQDDAHLFVRPSQLEPEIVRLLEFVLSILRAFGFEDFRMELSTKPEKAVGSDEIWEQATTALRKALDQTDIEYGVDEGGGAFYGPKIDVKIRDAIGRDWQCSTIQCDFNLPERFDMSYTEESGEAERPIMLHRALLGSLERFFGILIEHFGGVFPCWLAPVQVGVITVGERHAEMGQQVTEQLRAAGVRVELDDSADKVGAKIRKHLWQEKLQFIAVVGDDELESGKLSIRHREEGDLGAMSPEDLAAEINKRV